jgi:hypothetical protein
MKLTDKTCKNSKPKDKTYKVSDGHGLYLQIEPTGAKYWRYKYRFLGKQKTLAVGVYPEITLAEARSQREEARKLLIKGIDPCLERKKRKLEAVLSSGSSFEEVAREWHENNRNKWVQHHANDILHRLEKYIFPHIGSMPISKIESMSLLSVLKEMQKSGAIEVAHRMRQICEQVFRYAKILKKVQDNPACTPSAQVRQIEVS